MLKSAAHSSARNIVAFGLFSALWLAHTDASAQQATEVDLPDPASILSAGEDPGAGLAPRTPEQIIALAMQQNPDLRASLLAWQQTKLEVISQDNQFVPNAFGELGYTTGRRPYELPGGRQLLSNDSFRAAAGINHTFRTATQVAASIEVEHAVEDTVFAADLGDSFGLGLVFQLSQPWLRGFDRDVILAELHLAELRRDSALAERERLATQLARQALETYWSLWFAEQQIRINQSALALANQEMTRAREQLDVGIIAESDLVPLMTELARLEEDLEQSRAARRETQFQLATLLGLSPSEAGITPTAEPPEVNDQFNEANLQATAEARSYQLQALQQNIEIARIQATLAQNRSLPDLRTNATFRISGLGNKVSDAFEQIGGFEAISAMINLRLELPIINRAAQADAERAQIGIEIARTRHKAALDQLQGRIASAISNFQAAQRRLALAQKTADLAARQVEIQTTLFANGTTTMLDVVNALQQQNQARLRIARARIDILRLRLEIEDASGTLLERLSVNLGDETG